MGLTKRVEALEEAMIALGVSRLEEFGDSDGHPFRGNQYTKGGDGQDIVDGHYVEKGAGDHPTLPGYSYDPELSGRATAGFTNEHGEQAYVQRRDLPVGHPARAALDVKAERKRITDTGDIVHGAEKIPTGVTRVDSKEATLGVSPAHGVSAVAETHGGGTIPQGIQVKTFANGVEVHNDLNGYQSSVSRFTYDDARAYGRELANASRTAKGDEVVKATVDHNGYQSSVQNYTAAQAKDLGDTLRDMPPPHAPIVDRGADNPMSRRAENNGGRYGRDLP